MHDREPEPTRHEMARAATALSGLSRRELLRRTHYSAVTLLLLAAAEQSAPARCRAGVPPFPGSRGGGRPSNLLQGAKDPAKQQFPYYADGPWDRPEYYETLQASRRMFPKTYQNADIDGDGRDELIARGPGGVHVSRYNPDTGQWVPMAEPLVPDGVSGIAPGKLWRDDYSWDQQYSWDQPQYYQTIQCADIDGDGRAELIGRGKDGIEIYQYDPSAQKWNPFPAPKNPDPGTPGGLWRDDYRWNQPEYYQTIQCAGVLKPGDPGYIGKNGNTQAVLIGRGGRGVETFTYRGDGTWDPAPGSDFLAGIMSDWSDNAGWFQPQYYMTIHLGDIDGDGRAELIGRGRFGMQVYKYDPGARTWNPLPAQPTDPTTGLGLWRDDDATTQWLQSQYALTIQCADLLLPGDNAYGGDGTHTQAVLIGRGKNGIEIYQYDPHTAWSKFPNNDAPNWPHNPNGTDKLWNDFYGWFNHWNYLTIQCADINGDGRDELIGRGGRGLEFYACDPNGGTWSGNPPYLDQWTDDNGWNRAQYYHTIQSARVLKPAQPGEPADPGYHGDGAHTQAVVLGRGSRSMQTYRFVDNTTGWVQTSAPLPAFTETQQAAYVALDTALRGTRANGNLRSTYNNQTLLGTFARWQTDLYDSRADPLPTSYDQAVRPHSTRPVPSGISQVDWDAVTWQVYWELQWVQDIYDWYGPGKAGRLIDQNTIKQSQVLQAVQDYLAVDDSTSVLFTILALLASVAGAILTGGASLAAEAAVATGLGVASAVAGGFSAAFSAVPGLLPGDPITAKVRQLEVNIGSAFDAALRNNNQTLFALTGGFDGGNYVPPDYGRLKQIGQWIEDGTWQWSTGSSGGTASDWEVQLARGYALYVWKTLVQARPWGVVFVNTRNGTFPSDDEFPTQYLYFPENDVACWFLDASGNYPPRATLDALFAPHAPGFTFPLAVPRVDVYRGKHGWPATNISDGVSSAPGNPVVVVPVSHPAPGVDLQLAVELSRDASTGNIDAVITLFNRGLTGATNVEITDARLNLRPMLSDHDPWPTHITAGESDTFTLSFPGLAAGVRAVLRVRGRYLGGTFGASLRVKLP